MTYSFDAPHFTNAEAARTMLEGIRWPSGPVCAHCGVINHAYATKRLGVYRCAEPECRKDFSVTTGTVMERSKIALHKWMMGFFLMCSSKKGISAHQLHRTLGITYQAAWFMCHRIREAMRDGGLAPMGGGGSIVEADETYFGNIKGEIKHSRKRYNYKPTRGGRVGPAGKRAIVALVERGGKMRSFHVEIADKKSVNAIITANIAKETRLFTDESKLYGDAKHLFADHQTVKHSHNEYVRGDVHTNTIESTFSVFKRGMKGIYQHCAEKHLHRYLAEFDFRYNHRSKLGIGDVERTVAALKGIEGKRLMYYQAS